MPIAFLNEVGPLLNDAFINIKLDKLIRQKLHEHIGEQLTQQLLDRIEIEIYERCGWAVPFHVHVDENDDDYDEPFLTWETPDGNVRYIRFRELL